MSFQALGLAPEILRSVEEQNYTKTTQIQQQAIPYILKGGDLMGLAQTGTGKTAAFALPLIHILNQNPSDPAKRVIRALILTPTRELAAQVGESVRAYSKYLTFRTQIIFGGVGIGPQISAMRRGADIVIATPGRLLDLIEQREVDLSKVEILVLDEADRMLDMGFIRDVKKIVALLPKKRQNLLFSATLSPDIQEISDSMLKNPKLIEVARRNNATSLVTQIIHPVDRKRKRELLSFMIGSKNWKQVLVFTRTKHGANQLCEQLVEDGLSAAAIHGNKSQGARTRALADFKSGEVRVLVATDIAARGIDIDQLPYVVNFDLPNVPEDYVHRIGRTGRAGHEGIAVSLVCIDEIQLLRDIERVIKNQIPQEVIAGYEPDRSIAAEPIQKGRAQRPLRAGTSRPSSARPTNARAEYSRSEYAPRPTAGRPSNSRPANARSGNYRSEDSRSEYAPRSATGRPSSVRPASGRSEYSRSEYAPRSATGRPSSARPANVRSGNYRSEDSRSEYAPRSATGRPSARPANARSGNYRSEDSRSEYAPRSATGRPSSARPANARSGNNSAEYSRSASGRPSSSRPTNTRSTGARPASTRPTNTRQFNSTRNKHKDSSSFVD